MVGSTLNLEFPEVLEKIPAVEEVWIFSGTTHY